MSRTTRRACLFVLAAVASVSTSVLGAEPRHVIVMISDGTSFNTWRMASIYEGKVNQQPYEQDTFVRFACQTLPLTMQGKPSGKTPASPMTYDPAGVWNSTPIKGAVAETLPSDFKTASVPTDTFEGYKHLKSRYTDSAASATALSTGVKTYNGSINWADAPAQTGAPLTSIYQIAADAGLSVGVVTSVPFCHATPAAFAAHNISRNNYHDLAREMLRTGTHAVIMGGGHPAFDHNGEPRTPKYEYLDEQLWSEIRQARESKRPFNGYHVISAREEFEQLANGADVPSKVFGLAEVASTLQQKRRGYRAGETPFSSPMNDNVPTLKTMAIGALRVLANDPDGFFVMIEGGATDLAAHSNHTSRAIEELVDFNRTVEAVIEFVDRPGDAIDWSNTLLIITTDHGNGLPLGANSVEEFFAPIEDCGKGKMPRVIWHTHGHTGELVPLFARGHGAQWLADMVVGEDSQYRKMYQLDSRWPDAYVDNTAVFKIAHRVIGQRPSKEQQ